MSKSNREIPCLFQNEIDKTTGIKLLFRWLKVITIWESLTETTIEAGRTETQYWKDIWHYRVGAFRETPLPRFMCLGYFLN